MWNNKLNRIITIDNPKDTSIRTKSIRWQLLLKLLYWKDSSFITPESYWNNSYLWPINSWRKLEFDELLKLSLESLLNSWYDEVQILWDSNLLINSWDNLNPSCNLWICNI